MSINAQTAFKATISPEYGKLEPLIEWCKRNCQGEWRFSDYIMDLYDGYTFLFETERDYVNFLLWKK